MKIIKCDRCGADISHQFGAVGGFTTKRKLAIMLIPEELTISEPNANSIVDLCETCDNQIYNEIFVNRNESAPEKSDDQEEIKKHPQNKERLQKIIMEAYNVRPSTAYALTNMVERFAEIACTEYEHGKKDSNKE